MRHRRLYFGVAMLLIAGAAVPSVASAAARLDRSDRREISRLFDRFVPAAVRRLDPLSASRMVTPDLNAGTSRADWKRGEIPVYPYPAKGRSFHGWTVRYIVGRQVGIELFLHPRRGSNVGPIAFNVVVKHVGKRWLVDSFLPAAVYTPPKKGNRISAPVDLSPGPPGGRAPNSSARSGLCSPCRCSGWPSFSHWAFPS